MRRVSWLAGVMLLWGAWGCATSKSAEATQASGEDEGLVTYYRRDDGVLMACEPQNRVGTHIARVQCEPEPWMDPKKQYWLDRKFIIHSEYKYR